MLDWVGIMQIMYHRHGWRHIGYHSVTSASLASVVRQSEDRRHLQSNSLEIPRTENHTQRQGTVLPGRDGLLGPLATP
jgi:hypothetical protein